MNTPTKKTNTGDGKRQAYEATLHPPKITKTQTNKNQNSPDQYPVFRLFLGEISKLTMYKVSRPVCHLVYLYTPEMN